MARARVAVLFGGVSEEHAVSVKSAQEVAGSLNLARYEPFYVGITRGGEWMLCERPEPNWERGTGRAAILSPARGTPGLLVLEHGSLRSIPIDVVLPVLHGRCGEDGAIQGLLELSAVPYVGCDIQSSALCMDKSLAYLVVASAGIATPTVRTVVADEDVDTDLLTYPVFVKPARSGSSFGVSRVDRAEDLASALEDAREFDSKVLIEQAVVGSEVGCAVLETESGLVVGEVDQIRLSYGFFRIHQESQPEVASENATIVVPAEITEKQRILVQDTARAIFRALGCHGLARVDMFLRENDEVVLNEVNTFPGMTSYSRYPRMMASAGVPLDEVIDRLLRFALNGKRR